MPAKLRPPEQMLAELLDTLSVTRLYETRLVSAAEHVHGLCDYGTGAVHIDQRPGVVEVLIHELLHARYPSWSERRVDREAVRLLSSMSEADVARWWRVYLRLRRKRKTPLKLDED
jgi:hypothetical protein